VGEFLSASSVSPVTPYANGEGGFAVLRNICSTRITRISRVGDSRRVKRQNNRRCYGGAQRAQTRTGRKLYERAIAIELKRRGHTLSVQKSFPVFYRGEFNGTLTPDLIVDDAVIVDPEVVPCFTDTHVA
jgi:hypothetical protein